MQLQRLQFFTQILSFFGISGACQFSSQLIDLKLYLQPFTEHFLSGINISNNAVFCLLGLLLKNIAVRMTGDRSRKGTVAKLAMRQPFVLFKGLTFQKLCLPGAFRPG
ncbi:hypothetical protein ACP80N_26740, partial [Escherichia coli]